MTIKNTEDLRRVLLDTLSAVKAGRIDARKAGAISGLSSQIISTCRLDLDFMKLNRANANGKKNTDLTNTKGKHATPLIEAR